jgi:hypothetical protein
MLNRRKAMIGWLVYSAAKPIAKYAVAKKAKQVATDSSTQTRSGAGKIAARAAALAAVAGGVLFWRSRSGKDDDGTDGGTDL